ncbi:MAG: hypothetical protein ACFFCW_19400, partial [Candidatus Hodarchaeota archaeon]
MTIGLLPVLVIAALAITLFPLNQRAVAKEIEGIAMEKNPHTREGRTNSPDPPGKRLNRLKFEKSPYLLQHADNPVDWY